MDSASEFGRAAGDSMQPLDSAGLRADLASTWTDIVRSLDDIRLLPRDLGPIEARAAANILHDFYTGVESIAERIALAFEGDLPQGRDWHAALLRRMATAIPGRRPELFSHEVARRLDEYLRFRHVVRHNYGFRLDRERVSQLLQGVAPLASDVAEAIARFDAFLASLSDDPTG